MSDQRPIIVVGCPRSGTTLLQLMLHAHPRIAIPPENRFVLPAYQRRREFGDLRDPANRRALAQWIVTDPKTKFRDFGLDPKTVIEQAAAAPPTLGSVLAAIFHAYARRFAKPRWGDKRPSYVHSLDTIHKLFPTAKFVNLVRDGRDCVASLKEVSWHQGGVYQAASIWAQAVDRARRAARRLGPDSFYELRYERLVADPEGELTALCDYLGEEYDPAMAQPSAVAPVVVPERKTHHDRTHEPVTEDRVGGWERRLDPAEIALCEAVLGERLRSHGYELSGAPAPTAADRLRYERVAFRRRFFVPKQVTVDTYERVRRPPSVAARS